MRYLSRRVCRLSNCQTRDMRSDQHQRLLLCAHTLAASGELSLDPYAAPSGAGSCPWTLLQCLENNRGSRIHRLRSFPVRMRFDKQIRVHARSQTFVLLPRIDTSGWFDASMNNWVPVYSTIDIGRSSPTFPVTPPCIRVRTRRFGELSF